MAGCGLFITGTDTGVGKTAVAVAIVRSLLQGRSLDGGLRVGVYKPVASGVDPRDVTESDAGQLWEAAGRPLSLAAVCPQLFIAPISPPASARAEGRCVDEQRLRDGFAVWQRVSDIVIVEGAGGLFSPLADTMLNADLVRDLDLPLVVVDTPRLGAIGRTLAVVEAAAARGLRVAAVVLSQVEPLAGSLAEPASPRAIARESARHLADLIRPVPVAELGHHVTAFMPAIDWHRLAQRASPSTP